MIDDVVIRQGFADELRTSAAELYDEAFGQKLALAIPDPTPRIAVLSKGFNPAFSFTATHGDALVGIAGFKTKDDSLTGDISLSLLRRELGWWGAGRAALAFALFHRNDAPDQLLMDGICVSADHRGKGVGKRLLEKILEYARREGYRSVRLDVIDTNPDARRLYERLGFEPGGTTQLGVMKRVFGFGAVTQMVHRLDGPN